MKNQYFGDVGDFGKYGLLTELASGPLKLGVNWYLTMDDTKSDGKHTNYFEKPEFILCDQELHDFLKGSVIDDRRNVNEISKLTRFDHVSFYNEILNVEDIPSHSASGRRAREKRREEWFESSLKKLHGCNLIFCDPDNGIETRSLSKTGKNSVKYIFAYEINTMIENGFSLAIYNHKNRKPDFEYINRIREICINTPRRLKMKVLRYNRWGVRDYIVLMQQDHSDLIEQQLDAFLASGSWSKHFTEIDI